MAVFNPIDSVPRQKAYCTIPSFGANMHSNCAVNIAESLKSPSETNNQVLVLIRISPTPFENKFSKEFM